MQTISLKKIGEVAEQLGTTPRALRFYEEEGLVSARRTPGGTRLYSEEDIARFRAILRLAHSGIPLALIKELATTREKFSTGDMASHNVHSVLAKLQLQVQGQINMLAKLESELSNAAHTIEGCFQCKNPPTRNGCPQCPVNLFLKSSEILNLVWEQDVEQSNA
ncbi:MAG: MerR family transcriptional regulator [Sulfuricella sp.]|nr:MerR family transcriptional regulator [Sulfuricella sp.]